MIHDVDWAMRPTGPLANLYLTAEEQEAVNEWLKAIRADERKKVEEERAQKFGAWHDYRPEMPW